MKTNEREPCIACAVWLLIILFVVDFLVMCYVFC